MGDLANTTVLVLGLGESGLAMARWCARGGARVRVWDTRDVPPNAAALAAHVPDAQWLRGPLDGAALDGVGRVLKSPGLAPRDARIAALLEQAATRGVAVQGELDLFGVALAQLRHERGYAPEVLAITGTNGKTTTTAMAALLVARTGRRVAVAGNIGPTMLQTLADVLGAGRAPNAEAGLAAQAASYGATEPAADRAAGSEAAPLPDVWILELSSFQLADAQAFEPSAGALLNLTEDHLDWHGDMAAYAAAKARVFGHHAVIVARRDDAAVERLLPAPASMQPKSARGRATKGIERDVVRFGLDAPRRSGDYGIVVENGVAWLARARLADEAAPRRRAAAGVADDAADAEPLQIQRLMPADALRVRGRHNAVNALAALALATAIGCPLGPMLHALRDYAGEPHRVEFVATVRGVDAFDDSKGTNVGATVAALDGLGAEKAPGRLVVILGGDGKGQDFAPLAAAVRRHARAAATLGADAGRIEAALAACGVSLQRHATLDAATRWSFAQAEAGDAVLLSPACASLDMFRNYAHRAEVFVAAVHALAADAGEVLA